MPALEVRDLSKWYGPVKGIEGVSFTVEQGEIFGYLGPNGSGKTTTIRCIMGLLRPTRGEVRVLDEPVTPGKATQHRNIGYLPGEFRIWRGIRGRRVLSMLSALGGRDHAKTRREELAERLALDLDRPVGELSKGNRQKVAIIHAFQHEPEVLILDEPTSGMDPLMRQVVLDLIREAATRGATILLSSHDLSEVAAVCGRAGILRAGHLVELAPISQIVQQGEHHLRIWFSDSMVAPALPTNCLPGMRQVDQQHHMLHVAYQGTADALLSWLSQFSVERIETPQTSLEEAFMQYYQSPSDAASHGEAAHVEEEP